MLARMKRSPHPWLYLLHACFLAADVLANQACTAEHCVAAFCTLATQEDTEDRPAPGQGYLSGNFAPVDCEVFARNVPVEGTLPAALDGVYIRNGPNPRFPPDSPAKYHWCAAWPMRATAAGSTADHPSWPATLELRMGCE